MLIRNVTTSIFAHRMSTTHEKRQRDRERDFFSHPNAPKATLITQSVLTPASPPGAIDKAYVIGFVSIALSTHLLCPSVHFTELELPAATLEEKKRWGMGNGACMALASPQIPESNEKPLNTQRCQASCPVKSAELSLRSHWS